MMCLTIRKVAVIAVFICISGFSLAQDPGPKTKSAVAEKTSAKPFRVLTNGQRITIQSSKNISNVIVWTSSGNRFVEQTNIETPTFTFTIPSKEKCVFMMVELQGGRSYTEKIGVE